MVCAPPNACEGRRKADWTAWVVLPWASLRTPRHTAIVCPCALAARSIPASMKRLVVPIWRIGPQWPEVPRARARIVSGPVIDAGRPLAVPLCTHATITSPRPLTATADPATMNRPSETRTGEPHGLPGRFTAARTAPPLAQVSAAVPSAPIASWNPTPALLATVVGVPHVAAPADAGNIAATDRATTRRRWRRTVTTTRNLNAAKATGLRPTVPAGTTARRRPSTSSAWTTPIPRAASRIGRGSLVVSGAGRASRPRRAVALRQQR